MTETVEVFRRPAPVEILVGVVPLAGVDQGRALLEALGRLLEDQPAALSGPGLARRDGEMVVLQGGEPVYLVAYRLEVLARDHTLPWSAGRRVADAADALLTRRVPGCRFVSVRFPPIS